MYILKVIALILLLALIVIQFFKPARNERDGDFSGAIAKHLLVPADVQKLLKNACYDCHSNNTRYPWYVNVQPIAWFMSQHIKDAKKELNFDAFGTYSKRRQQSKLRSIAGRIKDGSMPLSSYTFMHSEARLSKNEKKLIVDWALKTKDSLEAAK